MKKILLLFMFLLFLTSSYALATPFEDYNDFTGNTWTAIDGNTGKNVTKTVTTINDTGNPVDMDHGDEEYLPAFSFTHDILFNPEAESVNYAMLAIEHSGNQANQIEAWFVMGEERQYINHLESTQAATSGPFFWGTTSFNLYDYISDVSGTEWTIEFFIDEDTLEVNEQIHIASSFLYGDYNEVAPVPEPATLLLLGSGLLGLAGLRKRKSNK